ncbi:hypothetical protein RhiXN_11426 [Rhizoctonia solani]|uniref:Uncharacterized protein n=1 Tax=Rhizoctonia solani TaxID=456999 RepID=A0A8H8P2X6_9AGAM|nr:uncharacterized protein RhiXN_11426 [Rhizoctonia solani]QRW24514.1 hypothetical protein RhiXN_11426 [Rhizoctonia solani]
MGADATSGRAADEAAVINTYMEKRERTLASKKRYASKKRMDQRNDRLAAQGFDASKPGDHGGDEDGDDEIDEIDEMEDEPRAMPLQDLPSNSSDGAKPKLRLKPLTKPGEPASGPENALPPSSPLSPVPTTSVSVSPSEPVHPGPTFSFNTPGRSARHTCSRHLMTIIVVVDSDRCRSGRRRDGSEPETPRTNAAKVAARRLQLFALESPIANITPMRRVPARGALTRSLTTPVMSTALGSHAALVLGQTPLAEGEEELARALGLAPDIGRHILSEDSPQPVEGEYGRSMAPSPFVINTPAPAPKRARKDKNKEDMESYANEIVAGDLLVQL